MQYCGQSTETRVDLGVLYQILRWNPKVCISKEFLADGLEACFLSGKGWRTDFKVRQTGSESCMCLFLAVLLARVMALTASGAFYEVEEVTFKIFIEKVAVITELGRIV